MSAAVVTGRFENERIHATVASLVTLALRPPLFSMLQLCMPAIHQHSHARGPKNSWTEVDPKLYLHKCVLYVEVDSVVCRSPTLRNSPALLPQVGLNKCAHEYTQRSHLWLRSHLMPPLFSMLTLCTLVGRIWFRSILSPECVLHAEVDSMVWRSPTPQNSPAPCLQVDSIALTTVIRLPHSPLCVVVVVSEVCADVELR